MAVVESGGFAAAATALGLSTVLVSQQMSDLESESGRTLFNRIGPIVRLTFAGEEFLLNARRVLRGAANDDANTNDESGLIRGRLDMACLPTLAVAPMAPLVGRFRSLYPGVTVMLADPQSTAELLEFVRTGRSEIGMSSVTSSDDFTSVRLDDQDFCVVLPPETNVPDPLPVELLADMPMVAAPKGSSTRALLDDVLGQRGATANIVVETAQREALLPLIVAGAGSALLPRPLAESARQLGCVVVDPVPSVSRPVSLLHRTESLTPAARLFIEFAVGH